MFIEKLVVARLSRPDAADLVTAEDSGVDVAALREEATAIRVNLEEMASDRRTGRLPVPSCSRPPRRGPPGSIDIGAELDTAARRERAGPAGRGRERRRRVGLLLLPSCKKTRRSANFWPGACHASQQCW